MRNVGWMGLQGLSGLWSKTPFQKQTNIKEDWVCGSSGRMFAQHAQSHPESIPSPLKLGMVVYACNLNTWKTKAEGRGAQGYPRLPVKFEASLGYHETLLFKVRFSGCTFIYCYFSQRW